MKQFLIIIMLTCLASIVFAEDSNLEEISLDKLLRDYLPDCKIEKKVILDGKCYDFAIAKETGDILVVTGKEDSRAVYLYDKKGNLKWEKNYEFCNMLVKCQISDNGSASVITKYGEMNTNVVFDENGNIMFEEMKFALYLKPSPDGQYFYFISYIKEGPGEGIFIYDRSGKKLTVTGYDFAKERRIKPVFLYHNKVIVYMDSKIVFFDFVDGKFNLLSEYELGHNYSFNPNFQQMTFFNDKYIMISKYNVSSPSFLFDYNGNLIKEYPGYKAADFINEDEIIIGAHSRDKSYIKRINLSNNKAINYNYPFKGGIYLMSVADFDDYIIISRNSILTPKKDLTSAVFDKKSGRTVFGIQESIKCSSQNIVFLKQEENVSVLSIMENNNEK
ncbi:MAG: hypothetical protein CSB55_03055 [Candidatus Cloacimonadota bacterium]|nr:MAG: hypothetical protein CSB55_03055 [Candidatus Cloacimonadota bacterium]